MIHLKKLEEQPVNQMSGISYMHIIDYKALCFT